MKRFKDVFEETGKQYGVLYSDYGISDCDLSREDSDEEITHIEDLSFYEIRLQYGTVAEQIIDNSDCVNDSDFVTIYTIKGDHENYQVFVPSWWD